MCASQGSRSSCLYIKVIIWRAAMTNIFHWLPIRKNYILQAGRLILTRLKKISMRQLRYLIAVSEHGGFSAAAGAMRVSQPAVGLQIKALEEIINAKLFRRHARGVETTEAGKILVQDAKAMLALMETSVNRIRERAQRSETLQLGTTRRKEEP